MKLKKLIRLKTHFKYFAMKAGRVILYKGLKSLDFQSIIFHLTFDVRFENATLINKTS